ncbi:RING finger domain-containing protein [Endozoicomonas sp. ALD040]|uniref:RING finger domain-containing protein n=1 Tax=unclassified Endozoicomonas TaxID=2644528 RepID=UPI003BAFA51B
MESNHSVNDTTQCSICFGAVECKSIKLKCGHVFGLSCIKQWMKRTNQYNCLFCREQLTDDQIKEIKKTSLWERVVTIPEKTIKFLFQSIVALSLPVSPSAAVGLAVGAAGAAGAAFAGVGGVDVVPPAAAVTGSLIACVWAASEPERHVSVVPGIVTGVATGIVFGNYAGAGLAIGCTAATIICDVGNYLGINDF